MKAEPETEILGLDTLTILGGPSPELQAVKYAAWGSSPAWSLVPLVSLHVACWQSFLL